MRPTPSEYHATIFYCACETSNDRTEWHEVTRRSVFIAETSVRATLLIYIEGEVEYVRAKREHAKRRPQCMNCGAPNYGADETSAASSDSEAVTLLADGCDATAKPIAAT